MIYPTPIIIPVSRGHHGVSTNSIPLSAKITMSSLIIALILLIGFVWWDVINEQESRLEQIIFTLIFFVLEVAFISILVGIF
jgi:hypothetical protein